MSKALIEIAWKNFPFGGNRLYAMMAIAEGCACESGGCQLPLRVLAASARTSRSTFSRAIALLKKERWIVTDLVRGPGGVLLIQINVPKLSRSTRPH